MGRVDKKVGGHLHMAYHKHPDTARLLKTLETRYKDLVNIAGDAITIRDLEGVIVDANEAAANLTGYKRDELTGMNMADFLTPDSLGMIMTWQKALLKGEIVNPHCELEIVRKDGTRRYGESHITLFTHRGKPLGVMCIIRDITEHKWVDKKLEMAERNFRNSLDNSPLGVRIVTTEGKLLYANQAILDIYGYSSVEELKATPVKVRYIPESYAEHQKRKRRRRLLKPVPSNYEISIVRKDGEVRHLLVHRKPVLWGGEMRYQSLYEDITDRKKVEKALRESEEFNSSLLAHSPIPIITLRTDTAIAYVNPALQKLTGFSSAALIGKKPPYPWWIEETCEESGRRLARAIRRGPRKYEELCKRKNGERFCVETTFIPIKANGQTRYYLANWVDLSEQKRLKENMEFYISEITKAQEEERKRIACEIHDGSVQSLAALALELDAISKREEQLPESVVLNLKRLRVKTEGIIDELRRFSHNLRPGVIDQVGLVPALEILADEISSEANINGGLEITGNERRLTPEIELNLFRIAQEALSNVRRHSGATKATLIIGFTRQKVSLTILDNGNGFNIPEMLGDFITEGKMGIAGMYERARLLDSKLLLKSRVGKGTKVVVEVKMWAET